MNWTAPLVTSCSQLVERVGQKLSTSNPDQDKISQAFLDTTYDCHFNTQHSYNQNHEMSIYFMCFLCFPELDSMKSFPAGHIGSV